VPVMIGGATTSKLHTALKIAPAYPNGIVVYEKDAAQNVMSSSKLMNKHTRTEYISKLRSEYEQLCANYKEKKSESVSLDEARKKKLNLF